MGKYIDISDEQLQAMTRSGDAEAEEELVQRFGRLVKASARPYFLAGGDSEDLTQEGMMGLLSAIRTYNPDSGASFKTYAEVCIKRRLFTAIKSASRHKHTPLNTSVSFESSYFDETQTQAAYFLRDLEEQVLAKESTDEIISGFSTLLSGFELRILELFLAGLSYEEMAAQVQKSQKSVDNAVQRIRRKLARHLNLGEISPG